MVLWSGLEWSDSFFLNESATTEIYTYGHTLPLRDALPIFIKRPALLDAAASLGQADAGRSRVDVPARDLFGRRGLAEAERPFLRVRASGQRKQTEIGRAPV